MFFLGLILAQVATLSLADRTEARYIVTPGTPAEGSLGTHAEAATRPQAVLGLGWKHSTLDLGYGPLFTLSPLERDSRVLTVFHTGYVTGSYSWGKTRLIVSETAGYGSQNFRVLALSSQQAPTVPSSTVTPPAAPTTPPVGTTNMPQMPTSTGAGSAAITRQAPDRVVRFASSITSVALERRTSPAVTVRGEVSYMMSGAPDPADRDAFPVVRTPRALFSVRYRLGHADDLSTLISAQYSWATIQDPVLGETRTSVWISAANATWGHRFSAYTASQLGVGLSGTRTPLIRDFVGYSIYPTFLASITNFSKLARGNLGLSLAASSAPVVDLTTAVADPRVGVTALLGWQRDKFSSNLSVNALLSTAAPGSTGSLSAVGGTASLGYGLTKAVSVDAGVRMAYQSFEDKTVIPISYAAFVGLTVGLRTPL